MTSTLSRIVRGGLSWSSGCLILLVCVVSLRGEHPQPFHYKDGAPPAMTGGFGDKTCHSCHFDQALNNPDGMFEISGIPASYQPDSGYVITLRIARPDLGKAGFALSTRFDEKTPAGHLSPLDSTTSVSNSAETNPYATHTEVGAMVTGDTATFSVIWYAPIESGRSLVFNAAANAANGDDSEFGDWIYTLETFCRPD